MKRIIFIILLLQLTIAANAQMEFVNKAQFEKLRTLWHNKIGIDINIPEGFHIDTLDFKDYPFHKGKEIDALNVPGGIVVSNDMNCMISYPFGLTISNSTNQTKDIMTFIEFLEKDAGTTANRDFYINSPLCGKADTIIVSEQKLKTVYLNKYNTIVSIVTHKKHFMPLCFRLFFNDKSIQSKDETIKHLLCVVNYRCDIKNYRIIGQNISNYYDCIFSKYHKHNK